MLMVGVVWWFICATNSGSVLVLMEVLVLMVVVVLMVVLVCWC